MATKRTLRLRAIQPQDRVRVDHGFGPSRTVREERRRRLSKHTRSVLMPDGRIEPVRMTSSYPWTRRARRRLHNRIAKASRKANR